MATAATATFTDIGNMSEINPPDRMHRPGREKHRDWSQLLWTVDGVEHTSVPGRRIGQQKKPGMPGEGPRDAWGLNIVSSMNKNSRDLAKLADGAAFTPVARMGSQGPQAGKAVGKHRGSTDEAEEGEWIPPRLQELRLRNRAMMQSLLLPPRHSFPTALPHPAAQMLAVGVTGAPMNARRMGSTAAPVVWAMSGPSSTPPVGGGLRGRDGRKGGRKKQGGNRWKQGGSPVMGGMDAAHGQNVPFRNGVVPGRGASGTNGPAFIARSDAHRGRGLEAVPFKPGGPVGTARGPAPVERGLWRGQWDGRDGSAVPGRGRGSDAGGKRINQQFRKRDKIWMPAATGTLGGVAAGPGKHSRSRKRKRRHVRDDQDKVGSRRGRPRRGDVGPETAVGGGGGHGGGGGVSPCPLDLGASKRPYGQDVGELDKAGVDVQAPSPSPRPPWVVPGTSTEQQLGDIMEGLQVNPYGSMNGVLRLDEVHESGSSHSSEDSGSRSSCSRGSAGSSARGGEDSAGAQSRGSSDSWGNYRDGPGDGAADPSLEAEPLQGGGGVPLVVVTDAGGMKDDAGDMKGDAVDGRGGAGSLNMAQYCSDSQGRVGAPVSRNGDTRGKQSRGHNSETARNVDRPPVGGDVGSSGAMPNAGKHLQSVRGPDGGSGGATGSPADAAAGNEASPSSSSSIGDDYIKRVSQMIGGPLPGGNPDVPSTGVKDVESESRSGTPTTPGSSERIPGKEQLPADSPGMGGQQAGVSKDHPHRQLGKNHRHGKRRVKTAQGQEDQELMGATERRPRYNLFLLSPAPNAGAWVNAGSAPAAGADGRIVNPKGSDWGAGDTFMRERIDEQDMQISRMEEENLTLRERLFVAEQELMELRRKVAGLHGWGNGAEEEEGMMLLMEEEADNSLGGAPAGIREVLRMEEWSCAGGDLGADDRELGVVQSMPRQDGSKQMENGEGDYRPPLTDGGGKDSSQVQEVAEACPV